MQARRFLLGYLLSLAVPFISETCHAIRIGFWGTWDIPCGIAMYSKHIARSLLKLGYYVTHYDYHLSPDDLLEKVTQDNLDIINLQYQPKIIPSTKDSLLNTIARLRAAGIKVVITMHEEPLHAQELVDASDRVIYHKQPQHLRDVAKVAIVPMGVPVFNPPASREKVRQKYGFNKDDKILVSAGFLFPSKEIDIILHYLASALKHDSSLKVQLLHAYMPLQTKACQRVYERLIKIIAYHQLQSQVILITDFIAQEELSERIYISDVGYQWFNLHIAATSAVAKEYISTRTPLVVPHISHFHDIHYCGIKVTPCNHRDFVHSILKLLYRPKRLCTMRRHLENVYQQLNYDSIINTYDAILRAL